MKPVQIVAISAETQEFTKTIKAESGATFPFPIYSKWADAYKKETGNGLNYQSIGSGAGIKQIQAKTVTFGATDAPLTAQQLTEGNLLQFPTVMGSPYGSVTRRLSVTSGPRPPTAPMAATPAAPLSSTKPPTPTRMTVGQNHQLPLELELGAPLFPALARLDDGALHRRRQAHQVGLHHVVGGAVLQRDGQHGGAADR